MSRLEKIATVFIVHRCTNELFLNFFWMSYLKLCAVKVFCLYDLHPKSIPDLFWLTATASSCSSDDPWLVITEPSEQLQKTVVQWPGCCIGVKIMIQIFSEAKLFNLDFALSWNTSYEELPLIINWSIKVHLSITRYFNFQFGDSSWGRFRSRRCECGQCDQPRHQHPSSSSS